jgi:hypothetical protein
MNSFTYVISTVYATPATIATANNCNIELIGLPNDRRFKCEVIDFVLDIGSLDLVTIGSSFVSLTASSEMQILDGVLHQRKCDRLCNFNLITGAMTGTSGNIFTVDNFNKHTVNFQLIQPNMTRVPTGTINQGFNTFWTLTLKMTPIIY